MEVKAVFFDIDGTLVNDRKSVLKSTKDAIKIVKEQGVLVGVATGRGPLLKTESCSRARFPSYICASSLLMLKKRVRRLP